jgi:hypothetical protein
MVGSAGVAGDIADSSTAGEVEVGPGAGLGVDLLAQEAVIRTKIRMKNRPRPRTSNLFTFASQKSRLPLYDKIPKIPPGYDLILRHLMIYLKE